MLASLWRWHATLAGAASPARSRYQAVGPRTNRASPGYRRPLLAIDLYPAFRLATNSARASLTASASGGECWQICGYGAEAWRVQLALPEAVVRPLARGVSGPHLAARVRY